MTDIDADLKNDYAEYDRAAADCPHGQWLCVDCGMSILTSPKWSPAYLYGRSLRVLRGDYINITEYISNTYAKKCWEFDGRHGDVTVWCKQFWQGWCSGSTEEEGGV